MVDVLNSLVSESDIEDIRELVSTVILLTKEDRAILLSNANAFKVRRDIERIRACEKSNQSPPRKTG